MGTLTRYEWEKALASWQPPKGFTKPTAIAICWCLTYAGTTECFKSDARIALETGIERATVNRYRKMLVSEGVFMALTDKDGNPVRAPRRGYKDAPGYVKSTAKLTIALPSSVSASKALPSESWAPEPVTASQGNGKTPDCKCGKPAVWLADEDVWMCNEFGGCDFRQAVS